MIKIGLTGSIGMGKTCTAALFQELGVPVYDADAEVHRLYAKGGAAVALISSLFPSAVVDGAVDRDILARLVLGDKAALERLEKTVHPLLAQRQQERLAALEAQSIEMVVLDIPLLFETQKESRVDVVVVVSAPPQLQRERVLLRPGMNEAKFEAILARQIPDSIKREKADYIVLTDQGVEDARAQVQKIITDLRTRGG